MGEREREREDNMVMAKLKTKDDWSKMYDINSM